MLNEVRPGLPLDLGHPWGCDNDEELGVDILRSVSDGLLTSDCASTCREQIRGPRAKILLMQLEFWNSNINIGKLTG